MRAQGIIIFATGGAVITGMASTTSMTFTIADGNGNSMPTGSDVSIDAGSAGKCGPDGGFTGKIANTLVPSQFTVAIQSTPGTPCAVGNLVQITVTSPLGLVTRRSITVQ